MTPTVYKGKARKLYLYGCPLAGAYGWYPNASTFRSDHPTAVHAIRYAQEGVDAPAGYRKTGRGLANEPIEAVKTMRDFVHALAPR